MRKLYFALIVMLLIAISPYLSAQKYLSKERENEIKMSEQYFWGECSDFKEEGAKQCAFVELSNQIIKSAVHQSNKMDEILKAIEMKVRFERLQQQGRIKILTWIVKDSVFVTIQKPILRASESKPALPDTDIQPAMKENPILQELAACKTYNDVRRVATMKGLVRGSKINSSEGFANPEKCIIAVFTSEGALAALLDTGSSSRTDLLSGKTVQNPEEYYNREEFFLWYMQQKNN